MDVYEFEKSFLDRKEESQTVLCWNDEVVTAQQVRREWACFIELQIEPAGWQALWKIPRVICEELKLRFPTIVYGCVEQVLFHELKAVYVVTAVQDDDVHIPERHELSLIDLWPTIKQENLVLNVETTADCLDRLRFFYTHVWMPWDNDSDDDRSWVEMHLDSRIQFACDLHKRNIKRSVAAHIRTLLAEARYIQQRREYLELGLSDDEDEEEEEETSDSKKGGTCVVNDVTNTTLIESDISDLMRLHLRLEMIKNEIQILENPEMRRIYNDQKFKDLYHVQMDAIKKPETTNYMVMKSDRLDRQMQLLELAKTRLGAQSRVQFYSTLQDVLSICKPSDNVYLSPGNHTVKFLENLNNGGSLIGLCKTNDTIPLLSDRVVVSSVDDDSILFVIDGNFTLEDLELDCRHIRTGILLKNGKLILRNCHLIGDNKSSTQQAIVCDGNSQLEMEQCIVEDFATGITLQNTSSLVIEQCTIRHCAIAIELSSKSTSIKCIKQNLISDSNKFGIYIDGLTLSQSEEQNLCLETLDELKSLNNGSWFGECKFDKCNKNIYILNRKKSLLSDETNKCLNGDYLLFDTNENYTKTGEGHLNSTNSPKIIDRRYIDF